MVLSEDNGEQDPLKRNKAHIRRLTISGILIATLAGSGVKAAGSSDSDGQYNDFMSSGVNQQALRERLKVCREGLIQWLEGRKDQISEEAGSQQSAQQTSAGACYQQALSDLIGDPNYHLTD